MTGRADANGGAAPLPTAGGWTEEYRTIVEHYFWSPQQLNRQSRSPSLPWDQVWAALRQREVPLNHLLNLFFRLAPADLVADLLGAALPGRASGAPEMLGLSGHPITGACQPDFAFACGGDLVFIEMKVRAKLSVEQVVKYALAGAALRPDGRLGLICLGPEKLFAAADEFQALMSNGGDPLTDKLRRFAQRVGVSDDALWGAMRRLELAKFSYAALFGVLDRQLGRCGAADDTCRKLVSGMMAALQDLNLVAQSSEAGV
jgi:hypothetical protein